MRKTELDILNERILRTTEHRKWATKNRSAWNEYQNQYQKDRKKNDPEYKARLKAAKDRYLEKKKSALVNS